MKFGKQFEAAQVPEWRYEYCNYKRLKGILKQIKLQRESGVGEQRLSRNAQSFHRLLSSLGSMRGTDAASAAASAAQPESVQIRHQEGEDDEFQTHFIVDEAVEPLERDFFKTLDSELEKVNAFYHSRKKEFVERAAALDEQMSTLISAKETLEAVKSDKSNGGASVRALQDGTLETVDEEGSVKQYKIDLPGANASEAFASLLTGLTSKPLLSLNLKKVKKAEALLQDAYKEFYHGLCLLKNYRSMNEIAVFKILKKYDKITSSRFLKNYLRTLDNLQSKRLDRLQKLIERVEHLFTKHFGESRQRAMEMLRPEKKVDRHRVTFTTGLFMGVSLALVVALVLTIRVQGLYDAAYDRTYMSSVFPVFSMFATIVLHLYLYGLNIYLWRKTWINHTFIFGLRRGTELSYRDLLAIAAGLSCLALVAMILHLQLTLGKPCCQAGVEIIPFIVIAGPFLCLFLPFNILYRSSRRFFLRTLWRCLLTPLYKVSITDFFLGDQMTSQVNAFRDFEYILCYYGGGFFRTRNSKACLSSSMFILFSYVMSALPYWCRMLQCFRRWFDEPDKMHLLNALKYFSTIVAVVFRLTYTRHKDSVLWLTMSILSSCLATLIQTYWDICVDWGLLKRKSVNSWLRDKLAIRYKSAYYFAIVSNVLLRFAWLQSLVNSDIKGINPRLLTLLGACLEVIRRGQWNYYRLENEHFNNVGRYRAVKAVPLPFVD